MVVPIAHKFLGNKHGFFAVLPGATSVNFAIVSEFFP